MAHDNEREREEENRRAFEQWRATQLNEPNLFDVLDTRNPRLLDAYMTPIFRQTAAVAAAETARVERVCAFVRDAYRGDQERAEEFLRRKHAMLGGESPLARAIASDAGAEEVIQLVGRAQYSGGV